MNAMQQTIETVVAEDGTRIGVRRSRRTASDPRTACLLLHGWPGTGADWEAVVAEASQDLDDVELIVPSLRGFDGSGQPQNESALDYSPAAHVSDLRAVMDTCEADRVIVVGYDLGATLAQQLAVANQRVTGLVLGCPAYAGIGERRYEPAVQAELWYQQFHQLSWAAELVAHDRHTVETYVRHFYRHWWGEGSVDERHFQRIVDAYAEPGAFEASIGWYRARASERARKPATRPAQITQPTVVLWGERDPVVPIRFADRLAEYFSDVLLVPLPAVGHFIPLESPTAVVQAVKHVLER